MPLFALMQATDFRIDLEVIQAVQNGCGE